MIETKLEPGRTVTPAQAAIYYTPSAPDAYSNSASRKTCESCSIHIPCRCAGKDPVQKFLGTDDRAASRACGKFAQASEAASTRAQDHPGNGSGKRGGAPTCVREPTASPRSSDGAQGAKACASLVR